MSQGWGEDVGLLLLELLQRGEVVGRPRRAQQTAWRDLVELGWVNVHPRRRGLVLRPERREQVESALTGCLPGWRPRWARMERHGLPPTPRGWAAARQLEREESAAEVRFPARLNRHTAAALLRPHSKSAVLEDRLPQLKGVELTSDAVVRIRPASGTRLKLRDRSVPFDPWVAIAGELILTERALLDGVCLVGSPRAVVTVENLGAYVDLPTPDDVTLVHVPGWDTRLALQVVAWFDGVPHWHFGDLDPNGVRILHHLREAVPSARWLVPDFWQESVDRAGMADWTGVDLPTDAAPWVRELAGNGRWLEQELVVLDPRWKEVWDVFG